MSGGGFLRPEALAMLRRWREVGGAALLGLAGVWGFTLGGWFFQGIGLAVVLSAMWLAVIAVRRLRFRRDVAQPGVVEVDEGQIRYFGPHGGGFAAVEEVVELEILSDRSGGRWWRLREAGGNVLAIPISAEGADQLFDAFLRMPGLTQTALLSALESEGPGTITVWRREAHGALT